MLKSLVGDRNFYKNLIKLALPIMIQNGITNFVSMLDNIMIGAVGTASMTGVAVANQLFFVFNLCIFGAVSGAGIFGAQYFGSGDHEGVRSAFRFKLWFCGIITLCGWEKHQNVEGMERVREQNRLRKQKQRAKEKALQPCHVTVTECHATEEDIEEEEETEEEKEYHSFTQAREEEWDEECAPDDRRKLMGGALGRNVVFLPDAQMEDLLNRLSLDEFDYYVSLVAENEVAGKHYKKKTHYQAILDMVKADRKVKGGKYGN